MDIGSTAGNDLQGGLGPLLEGTGGFARPNVSADTSSQGQPESRPRSAELPRPEVIAVAQSEGEAGRAHPRGRFVNMSV
ncbi:hypothetical protein ACTL6U_12855 [Rhodovibrionaceae bacterium A322]